ncbi:hypothetical protein SETIT_5G204100v2 [Setaria italica]|uniref:Uncharacterized protein n=2 Tax=Setaria italica TaxID=4555 RepID=A0A368R6W3_SETIT|nr:uncharacterized protein LOC101765834 isoform X1 [Setaria italica]RCV25927.1 hypothetical protein SETIT_5G204100v2 [Setaria italica]
MGRCRLCDSIFCIFCAGFSPPKFWPRTPHASASARSNSMPPRRRRRAPPTKPQPEEPPGADAPLEERLAWNSRQESECRITAIKAIKDAEAGDIRSWLQLVQSYLSKEQLEANVLEYFQENFPNLSVVPNEKYDVLELKWNDGDRCIIGDFVDDNILQASIASLPTAGVLQFLGDSVGKDFYRRTGSFSDFAWSELPEGQMAGAADAFQTPGAVSNQLSFGMTPKTVRLPKNGEMLLSVHGSPLGVYKEENLAAVQ